MVWSVAEDAFAMSIALARVATALDSLEPSLASLPFSRT